MDDKVTLDWKHTTDTAEAPARTVALPANVQKPLNPINFGVFMLKSTADTLGVDYRPSFVLAQLPAAPTQAERDAAMEALLTVSPSLSRHRRDRAGAGSEPPGRGRSSDSPHSSPWQRRRS